MGASPAFAIVCTFAASLVTMVPAISPSTSPAPTRTAIPQPTPILLSAGLGTYARAQGDGAKNLLFGLESALATEIYLQTGKAVRFRTAPESADYRANCAAPSPEPSTTPTSAPPTPAAILELTYGQTIAIESDYFLVTHHAEEIHIGAVLLDCGRHILGYFPPIDAAGAGVRFDAHGKIENATSYYTFANQANAFSLVGLYGGALIANANTDNKIAGALVTFIGAAQAVDVPAYPKESRGAETFRDAVFQEAWWLLQCTDYSWMHNTLDVAIPATIWPLRRKQGKVCPHDLNGLSAPPLP